MADLSPWNWVDYSSLNQDQRGHIIPQAQKVIQNALSNGNTAPQVYSLGNGQISTEIPQSFLSSTDQIYSQPNMDSSNVKSGSYWALPGGGFTAKEPSAQGYAPEKSKGGKSIFDFIAPIAEIGLSLAGQPELGAAIAGISSGVKTGSPLAGLAAAGGSYFGSQLGGQLGDSLSGSSGILSETPANALGNAFGGDVIGSVAPFGSFAGNALGSATIGNMAGSALGGSIGQGLGESLAPQKMNLTGALGPTTTSPAMQPSMGLPQSLSQFSGLTPQQQGSNIATKGVYGGGNGPQETNYFLNLMNRQLFDNGGGVSQDLSGINPVEMGYLNQLGISGSSPTDVLKGISQYGA